jgi:cyanophycinase
VLGMGIDEDTAAIVDGDQLRVIGSGAVYIVDGTSVTHSNLAEAKPDITLSMHNVTVHVLAENDTFDLKKRKPHCAE